jgi:hypothetical protein
MTWNVEYRDDDRVVCMKATGSMNLEQIKEFSSKAIGLAKKRGTNKYWVNFKEMTPDLTTFEIYSLPRLLIDLGTERDSLIGMVFSEDSIKKDDFLFFETVSQNQGLNVRLFTEPGKATEWLKGR